MGSDAMSAPLFGDPSGEPVGPVYTECVKFWWIGQSFDVCDNCGAPYWDHPFRAAFGGEPPDFVVLVKYSWRNEPVREGVKVIPPADAARCRAKWEGYLESVRAKP
jgi:hypothetical protein